MAHRGIGVDVGGTKIAAGVVTSDGAVGRRLRQDTPADDADAIAAAIVDLVRELDARDAPVGVGAAGFTDLDGTVRFSPNLPGWREEPLAARLGDALAQRVVVVNDADAATWAEFRHGAGHDVDGLLMVTVGTGVGGGVVIHERLVRGATGGAGEIGHIIVDEGGPLCGCGNRGCLESHASGRAIARKAAERRDRGEVAATSPLDAAELTGADVTQAARDGDPDALAVLHDAGRWLGVGLVSLVHVLDPPRIAVGGGVMAAGELLLQPAREACDERLLGRDHRDPPAIVTGELGGDAGMIGAALLAVAAADQAGERPPARP